jgi:hypothetical protein
VFVAGSQAGSSRMPHPAKISKRHVTRVPSTR